MSRVYELESDKAWLALNERMWIRPYFDMTNTQVWMVTCTILDGKTTLGVFKQYAEYSLE